ncbi:type IV secretion system protein [Actinomadura sp. DC4]|uniref:type IV secretion system protein n=1 Tax=Actinomadura sp. DC4 TaxID=3055069 RepID=UPI0025B1A44C|nr:type IV secretion system protein [Actinomadura sp. DC4]MDN3352625.1 type IV secretion system protein [Actinomadura sp. DC4]
MAVFVLSPLGVASADPPINTNPNDACSPADHPSPEEYGSGIDGMVKPPDYPSVELQKAKPDKLTYYDRYGTEGQSWHAVDMGCSDAMAMVGNSISNVVFTLAKAFDRTTITIYQAAASESLLGWLKKTVDGVIHGMGNTFGAKYWSWVVILGALWLAWWGLIRRRASRVAEGTIWMVLAMVALVWLIGRPSDFTTLGTKVSNGATTAFNAALPQSNANASACIPGGPGAQQAVQDDSVTRNANGLWVTLVCKPWLMGEFGTDDAKSKVVQENGAKLLSAQAVDLTEAYSGAKPNVDQKADDYKAVTKNIKNNYPGVYPLFQGKNWTSRLAVSFGALLAALVAGLLVLIIAVMLMVLKISFLLLLVAGPIFLGIGIHPGIGRVIAVRWFELLLSTLLKQAALIGVLALLLWCYGLVMAESLPWGLQILLISLVTLAAFIYRKPFQHLFAAVGYSAVGSRKSEEHVERAVRETRKRSTAVAAAAVPGTAGYRFGRWAKREAGPTATAPSLVMVDDARDADIGRDQAGAGGAAVGSERRGRASQLAAKAAGTPRGSAPPLNLSPRSQPPATPSGGKVNGGTAVGPRSGRSGSAPPREPAAPSGGGNRPPAAPVGPSWGTGGRGGGQSSGGGTPPRRQGGENGGRGWFGGGNGRDGASSGGGSGGGRGWLGGGSGGRTAPRGDSGGPSTPKSAPGRGTPKRDPAAAGSGQSDTGGDGGGRQAPPLWSGKSREDAPAMPFWLRPVKSDDGEE